MYNTPNKFKEEEESVRSNFHSVRYGYDLCVYCGDFCRWRQSGL